MFSAWSAQTMPTNLLLSLIFSPLPRIPQRTIILFYKTKHLFTPLETRQSPIRRPISPTLSFHTSSSHLGVARNPMVVFPSHPLFFTPFVKAISLSPSPHPS